MQKLIDTLKSFGIEIPEDKQADVKKALSEHYKNAKEVAKTLSKVEGERDNWKERAETAEETLNELLVGLFKDLMEIEARCLITEEFSDISINDMHIIEAIGVDEPKRSGTVAALMSITLGTLTKAIDGLTRKGYVSRIRSDEDKRVVKLSLTDKGKSAFYHHEQFHEHMIEHIKDGVNPEELKVLVNALAKLSDYFKVVYSDDEENQYQNWDNINEDNK